MHSDDKTIAAPPCYMCVSSGGGIYAGQTRRMLMIKKEKERERERKGSECLVGIGSVNTESQESGRGKPLIFTGAGILVAACEEAGRARSSWMDSPRICDVFWILYARKESLSAYGKNKDIQISGFRFFILHRQSRRTCPDSSRSSPASDPSLGPFSSWSGLVPVVRRRARHPTWQPSRSPGRASPELCSWPLAGEEEPSRS
jgi:hypothetical protein